MTITDILRQAGVIPSTKADLDRQIKRYNAIIELSCALIIEDNDDEEAKTILKTARKAQAILTGTDGK